ncbi:phosphotransferase [Lipingzhangella sp. LS1_29]|uniref:Phosphotransferase n=1 Tax=Lipingzhangella rawalii TaxID=2055835 RepID=A0ABU2H7C5_9ACTN|nr:phosphotransferase [Lipingzhangella rawalii]
MTRVARPTTEDLAELAARARVSIVSRADIRVWPQSGVERVHFADGRTAVLKYTIPDFAEDDALGHAAYHGLPVPALLAKGMLPGGEVAVLMEDLGAQIQEPTLREAARLAVMIHRVPGPPERPVLDREALSVLPESALECLRRLRQMGRWRGEEARGLRGDLERIAQVARHRARGAEIPPFGLAHSEFHPTSIHIGRRGSRVLDWARCYTGSGLLDLASWQGTQQPFELARVEDLLTAYLAAGGPPSAAADRGGLPAHVWASAWHKVWITEWFVAAQERFLPLTDPGQDVATIQSIRVHLAEAGSWLMN